MRLLLFSSLLILFTGCNKLNKLKEFNIYYSKSVVVPASASLNLPINLPTPDITTNSETTFENNNTKADLVESIYLNKLDIAITNPTSANFNFLKSVAVYISTSSLPEVKIAYKDSIANSNSQTVSLDLTSTDLSAYLKSSSIKFKLIVVTDELITSDYTVDIQSGFHVKAKILK